ncbi:tyrosine-type recombinase/integrase [Chromobacterium amazonense]|uniref:tyrosine-type recombinase/integrase n=1 Tax=Chromobacterium amazonense TaxID=1382803 RepID=UPI003F79D5F5
MRNHAGCTAPDRELPTIKNRKVPVRRANATYRNREYLVEKEVTALMEAAARIDRHRARDATLILIAYQHGLRVSELVSLRWDQVDLSQGLLHVVRRKHGIASVHPLRGPELRALRRLQRDYPDTAYVFVSERKAPLTAQGHSMLSHASLHSASNWSGDQPSCSRAALILRWPAQRKPFSAQLRS